MYFYIIIPTIGRPELGSAIGSVRLQNYLHRTTYIVHDNSQCDSPIVHRRIREVEIYLPKHNGSGGCRNAAIQHIKTAKHRDDEYILFLDDDDTLASNDILTELADFIENHNYPDMIRLPYIKHFESGLEKNRQIGSNENDIFAATLSKVVGPPTKAIKLNKIVEFEPIIKHQDVIQHIDQCDVCDTVAVFDKPYFVYNIYDRPDKDKKSPESILAGSKVPEILKSRSYNREVSKKAAETWARKIEALYKS